MHRAYIWNRLHEEGAPDDLAKPMKDDDDLAPITMDSEIYFTAAEHILEELELLRATSYMMMESHNSWLSVCKKLIADYGLLERGVIEINNRYKVGLRPNTFDYRERHKPLEFESMERDCQERIDDLLDMCTEAADRLEARKIKAMALKKTCRHLAKKFGADFGALERLHEANLRQVVKNKFYVKYPIEEARAFVEKVFVNL